MANHARVKTKLEMTPETITTILERLNNSIFKNLLIIEYSDCRKQKGCWGEHVWEITVKGGKSVYGYHCHVCGYRWLNEKRTKEEDRKGQKYMTMGKWEIKRSQKVLEPIKTEDIKV